MVNEKVLTEINIDANGFVIPTGQLKIFTAEMKCQNFIYYPHLIWIDEAGVKWNIDRVSILSELKPIDFPKGFVGEFYFNAIIWGNIKTVTVNSNSIEEAIKIIKINHPGAKKESIDFKKVKKLINVL